jgi:hypothetical protein
MQQLDDRNVSELCRVGVVPFVHHRGRLTRRCGVSPRARFGLYIHTLLRQATHRNAFRRIVALEEVAGSSPVGHPVQDADLQPLGHDSGVLLMQWAMQCCGVMVSDWGWGQ